MSKYFPLEMNDVQFNERSTLQTLRLFVLPNQMHGSFGAVSRGFAVTTFLFCQTNCAGMFV